MSDVKKLVTLLSKTENEPEATCPRKEDESCKGCEFETTKGTGCDSIARKAKYLVQNGVYAPPLKVGETVYSFCDALGRVLPYFIEGLHIGYIDENIIVYQYTANATDVEREELLDSIDFEPDDVGDWVFRTEDEAIKNNK